MRNTNNERKKINWRSGTGSEILAVLIAILACAFMVYICVFFGVYNSEIQSQIMADIIIDGSVAYAQNEMNLGKKPLHVMADKLYAANAAYNNGVELVGMSCSDPVPVSENLNANSLSRLEKQFLAPRAQIMKGMLKTLKYNTRVESIFSVEECVTKWGGNINDPQYKDIEKLRDTKKEYYDTPYNGARYMDEFVTVSVTAKCKIPLFSDATIKTKSAKSLSIALVPYNSRVPADSKLTEYFNRIESTAFAGCENGGGGDIVPYGSTRYKMLLTARRALGDGYHTIEGMGTSHWPNIPKVYPAISTIRTNLADSGVREEISPYKSVINSLFKVLGVSNALAIESEISPVAFGTYTGQNEINYLKYCDSFVRSCFAFDGMNNLDDAMGLPHEEYTRETKFKRVVPAEEIWEEMHPEQIEITANKNSEYHPDTGWFVHKEPGKDAVYEWVGEGYDYTKTVDGEEATWVIMTTPPKTLAEELTKYGHLDWDAGKDGGGNGDETAHIWEVASSEALPLDSLQTGDILVWESPNWYPCVSPELQALAAMNEKPDDFSQFDEPGFAICHWAIYFGGNELLHMTGEGVCISSFDTRILEAPAGWDGPVLYQVIRFTDDNSKVWLDTDPFTENGFSPNEN